MGLFAFKNTAVLKIIQLLLVSELLSTVVLSNCFLTLTRLSEFLAIFFVSSGVGKINTKAGVHYDNLKC